MTTISMLIDGELCAARSGATFTRRNPLDGAVATTAPAGSVDDALAAVEAAAKAFPGWSATGPGERRRLLAKAADAIESRAADFSAAMAAETGASPIWAGCPLASAFIRVEPGGRITHRVPTDGRWAVACALGGADRKTLYCVTADTSLSLMPKGISNAFVEAVDVAVPGAGLP